MDHLWFSNEPHQEHLKTYQKHTKTPSIKHVGCHGPPRLTFGNHIKPQRRDKHRLPSGQILFFLPSTHPKTHISSQDVVFRSNNLKAIPEPYYFKQKKRLNRKEPKPKGRSPKGTKRHSKLLCCRTNFPVGCLRVPSMADALAVPFHPW